MSEVCERHRLPLEYVCMAEECKDSSPLCADEDCLVAHLHSMELHLLPISSTSLIERRRAENHERMNQNKQNLSGYFDLVRKDLSAAISAFKRECTVLDKIVLGVENLKGGTVSAMDNLLTRNYSALNKVSLDQLYDQMRVSKLGQQGQKLDELEREIASKLESIPASIKLAKESVGIRKVYKLDLYNMEKRQLFHRFDSSSSTWSFGTNKIDAIQITSSSSMLLAGFVHMQLLNCPGDGINLALKITSSDGQVEFQENKVIPKEVCLASDFEIVFANPFHISSGKSYDLSSQNVGAHFQAKSGQTSHVKAGPFTFEKSKLDNNGTSATSGQFKSLICFDLL